MKNQFNFAALALLFATLSPQLSPCFAQGTAFTYQGWLNDGTNPASGKYDLRFAIYDAASAGTQQGNSLTTAATGVTNGLFTVTLDFGNQFPGANRWLEIAVRTSGAAGYFTLSPRQALTPAPYAITAGNVNAVNLSGTIPDIRLSPNVALLNGTNLFTKPNQFNGLVGIGVVPATTLHIQGTNVPLIRVQQVADIAASLELSTGFHSWRVGQNRPADHTNFVDTFFIYDVDANTTRFSIGSSGNIALGSGNTASGPASLATGGNTTASGDFATAMGQSSTASGSHAVAAGQNCTASAINSVAMGESCVASTQAATALGSHTFANGLGATALGAYTSAGGPYSVAMGYGAQASGDSSTAMGYESTASGQYSTAMGQASTASGLDAVAAGLNCTASGINSVAMGESCQATNLATTALGYHNVAGAPGATAMGVFSQALHNNTFVWSDGSPATSFASTANDQFLVYASGGVGINKNNPGSALDAVSVAGGNGIQGTCMNNAASGVYGENMTGGGYGVAGRASGAGQAVFGDNVNSAGWAGYFNGNVRITGTLNPSSDRNVKKDFANIAPGEILQKVVALNIQTWVYTNDASHSRHLGPVAQDFKAAFELGHDDKTIATVDADGVALAAIQGLNQKLETENSELRAQNAAMEARVAALEKLVAQTGK